MPHSLREGILQTYSHSLMQMGRHTQQNTGERRFFLGEVRSLEMRAESTRSCDGSSANEAERGLFLALASGNRTGGGIRLRPWERLRDR